MELARIELAGKEYPLCFSVAAIEMIEEKFGGFENMTAYLSGKNITLGEQTRAVADILSILLECGSVAAAQLGKSAPDFPSVGIEYFIGFWDLPEIVKKIYDVIGISAERKQEAEPPKNAAAPVQENQTGEAM